MTVFRAVTHTLGVLTLTGIAFYIAWWGLIVRIKHVSATEGVTITNKWSPR